MTDWGEIGEGDHPAQNPPPLGSGDAMAFRWYNENATGFVKDFGIMPTLLNELGLTHGGRSLFLMKVSLIHRTMIDLAHKEAEERNRHG